MFIISRRPWSSSLVFCQNRKCPEYPERLMVKSTVYTLNTYTCLPHLGPFCSTTRLFRATRLTKIENAPNNTTVTLHLTVKRTLYIPGTYIEQAQSLVRSLNNQSLARYKVIETRKDRKYTKWPLNGLEHLTGKRTLHTRYLLTIPKFWPFRSTTIRFRDAKRTLYTGYLPIGPKVWPFRSSAIRYRDTSWRKSEIRRMTSEWLWIFIGQKVSHTHLILAPEVPILIRSPQSDFSKFCTHTKKEKK